MAQNHSSLSLSFTNSACQSAWISNSNPFRNSGPYLTILLVQIISIVITEMRASCAAFNDMPVARPTL